MRNRIISLIILIATFIFINSCNSDSDSGEDIESTVSSNDTDAFEGESSTDTDSVEEDVTEEESPESEVSDEENTPGNEEEDLPPVIGTTPIIIEEGGRLRFEAEVGKFDTPWELRTDRPNFNGTGYLYWNGANFFGEPGNGVITYKLRIQTPGTYGVEFRQIIAFGRNNNEYNDIWLRFPDADNFFGRDPRNASAPPIVFPRGGANPGGPFPEGGNRDGWFKIFAKSFNFAFRTVTGDDQGFRVFATFNSPGDYTLEVSGRSMGYGLDQIVMFLDGSAEPRLNDSFISPVVF